MGLDGIYNVPGFRPERKVERAREGGEERKQKQDQGKKKKQPDKQTENLFASLADRLGQYGDEEPFQFSG